MKLGAVVALVVLSGCLGLLVGVLVGGGLRGADPVAAAPEEDRGLAEDNARLRARLAEFERDAEREEASARETEDEVAASRDRVDEIREARAAEAARAGEGDATTVAPPAKIDGARFFGEEYDGALNDIDWGMVGTNLREMLTLIPVISRDLKEGRPPSAEAIGRIQQLNGPLLTAALKLPEAVPGTGANGKFSDPTFMLNALATTLDVAGEPLTDAQEKALEETARLWLARDRQRREGYDDRTWQLRKLYEEAEVKDGFFREAFSHLTPKQIEVARPEDIRDRVRMDLFSSALIYVMRIRPVVHDTREDLVQEIEQGASMTFRLTEEERERARAIIADWVDGVPRPLLDHVGDVLDREGIVDAKLATQWAKLQLAMMKRLATDLAFDEDRMGRARGYGAILYPMKRSDGAPADD